MLSQWQALEFDALALSRLARRSQMSFRSPAGRFEPLLIRGVVGLVHDDGSLSSFALELPLALTDPPDLSLPSLLGMDILCLGTLTINGPASTVHFDVAPAGFDLL